MITWIRSGNNIMMITGKSMILLIPRHEEISQKFQLKEKLMKKCILTIIQALL